MMMDGFKTIVRGLRPEDFPEAHTYLLEAWSLKDPEGKSAMDAMSTDSIRLMVSMANEVLEKRGVVLNPEVKVGVVKSGVTAWARYVDGIDDTKGVPFVFRIEGDWIKGGASLREGALAVVGFKYTGEDDGEPFGRYLLVRGRAGVRVSESFRFKTFELEDAEVLAESPKMGGLEARLREELEGKT
jgi:hypothetical protein